MLKHAVMCSALILGVAASGLAIASDDKALEAAVKYRKAVFTMVGSNFKPMGAMVKDEAPWDDAAFKAMAADLGKIAQLNIARGFPEGSDKGDTDAKSDIWKNMDDFKTKLDAFTTEAGKLAEVASAGDKAAMIEQYKVTGKTCKSCHDDYKKD